MSEFKTEVVRVTIEPHPNADRLELARIGDYQSIVGKGVFASGDLVAYIQESSIVPQGILEELGLVGKLAGSKADRVKAVRLRGILSQGICYPAREGWSEGDDVSGELGITKYSPPIPTHMAGEVFDAGPRRTVRYDIENIKRYPDVLVEGERVRVTEKLHGTFCCMGVVSEADAHPEHGRLCVSSKGLGGKGLAFAPEEDTTNLYLRAARAVGVLEKLSERAAERSLFVLGEVFGRGVQDLAYGADVTKEGELGFRVFDVRVGPLGDPQGYWMGDEELTGFCEAFGLEQVPVLYRGPFSKEKVLELTDGVETVSGTGAHLREGVVVRPTVERRDDALGRVQLKSVSAAYLTRKGGTEYN